MIAMRAQFQVAVLIAIGLSSALPARAEEDVEAPADLVHVVEYDAPLADVWDAFTTKALVEKWMVPLVEFDLRSGGTMKTNYRPAAGIGGPGTIVHHLLVVQDERLLVTRTEAPSDNPMKSVIDQVVLTWAFEPLGCDRSRVILGMHGWPPGRESQRVRAFFASANPTVLAKLQELYPRKPSGPAVLELLKGLEGEWTHEGTSAGGRPVESISRVSPGPGGRSVTWSRHRRGPDGTQLSEQTTIWIDPESGQCEFQSLDEEGRVGRGHVRVDGGRSLVWDGEMQDPNGGVHRFRVETTVVSGDEYVYAYQRLEKDAASSTRELRYRRAAK